MFNLEISCIYVQGEQSLFGDPEERCDAGKREDGRAHEDMNRQEECAQVRGKSRKEERYKASQPLIKNPCWN